MLECYLYQFRLIFSPHLGEVYKVNKNKGLLFTYYSDVGIGITFQIGDNVEVDNIGEYEMAYIYDKAYASDDDDVSSHTGVLPKYDVGDMLVWIVHKDSATGTHLTVPDGWTQGYADSMQNEILICYKVAEDDETAPSTSSSDTDAFQSTLISAKACSGVGTIFSVKDSDGIPETVHSFNQDSDSSIGGVSIVFASWSSTGGGTISPFGFNLINEESTSAAMTINAFPINDLSDTPDIHFQHSASRSYGFFQFELLDDGDGFQGGSVTNSINMIENCIDGPLNSTTGDISINTINGITVDNTDTVIQDGYTDKGVSYIQKAVYVKVTKGNFFSGVELTFNEVQDFQTDNPLFLFNVYTDRPKYKPPIGNGDMGVFVYLMDTSGNYKVWNIDAADAAVKIISQDRSFVLDLQSTTYMDSSGTLDLLNIEKVGFGQNTRSINASYFDVSRMYLITSSVFYGGSVNIPSKIDDLLKFQTGAIMNVFLKQGKNILSHIPLDFGGGKYIHFDDKDISISFPKPYDLDTRNLNFHCRDNVMGIRFDMTDTSVVNIHNFVISGELKFFFIGETLSGDIQITSSTLANIGDNNLSSNMSFNGCKFVGCDPINSDGSTISSTEFINTTLNPSDFSKCSSLTFSSYDGKEAVFIDASITGSVDFLDLVFDGSGDDVYWGGTSGTLTVNLFGTSNASSFSSAGGDVVFVKTHTLSIPGLEDGSEVRVYKKSDMTEIMGEESTTNGFSQTFNYTSDVDVVITIVSLGFINQRFEYTLTDSDSSIPIKQIVDRTYLNPE